VARFRGKRHQFGFLVTHVGLLVLLVGAIQTFLWGIEGRVILQEGGQTDQFLDTRRSAITVGSETSRGRMATEFTFASGPTDWLKDRSFDFGTADGLGLKVLRFYRHARPRHAWVADELDFEGPALQLRLTGPSGNTVAEDWLAGNLFGGEAIIGPTRYDLLPLPVATMLEDVLHPPEALGTAGVLSVHYAGQLQRVRVDEHVGRRVPLGDQGAAVEIVAYLPDGKPSPQGGFVSVSDKPRNPILELKVHLPGHGQPLRQIAFAQRPLLNLDGVHGWICPVKFWYHHAGVKPVPGALFAQATDGKLYSRAASNGSYGPPREVQEGDRIALGGQFSVTIQRYLPRARQEVSFEPIEPARGQTDAPEAAALVEITTDGKHRTVWLQRSDNQYGVQPILTDRGPLVLSFGYQQRPLGYTVQLQDFVRRTNPGGMGDAAFGSIVRVLGSGGKPSEPREISMNQPLTLGRFTLYQSSFQDSAHGRAVSVLTAAYDPGRGLKYLGSLMICVGTFVMFYMRSYLFQRVPVLFGQRRAAPIDAEAPPKKTVPPPLGLRRRRSSVEINQDRT
jgi:hypothetical protein